MQKIELVIPDEIREKYNDSLSMLKEGDNDYVGNEDKMRALTDSVRKGSKSNVLVLGEPGVGKTAMMRQWVINRRKTSRPVVVTELDVEKLGMLDEQIVVSRFKDILKDMQQVKEATAEYNQLEQFDMCLFVDEVQTLRNYAKTEDSSGVINALKPDLEDGVFPMIGATTVNEYKDHLMREKPFNRRFPVKVALAPPTRQTIIQIMEEMIERRRAQKMYVAQYEHEFLEEIIEAGDAFIKDQENPAKAKDILDSCLTHCEVEYEDTGNEQTMNHDTLNTIMKQRGFNLDSNATAERVKRIIRSRIRGQPLAVHYIENLINRSFYTRTKDDYKKPFMTGLFIGTTGTGKTETSKALARALFGREDAMVVINGGDYATVEDAARAQQFIGDSMVVDKQQVVLIDEIEKAHKSVLHGFMRMIDEGVVRDSLGIERSITNTALIATSNLGAEIFSRQKTIMDLDSVENPDELTEELQTEWFKQESQVRESLQDGDPNQNNGIKPEFLERFQELVPYLPLSSKTLANIARTKLLKLRNQMRKKGYYVQLPKPISKEIFWDKYKVHYENVDIVSAMIAEDLINQKASSTGARAITRFISGSVESKLAAAIAEREKKGLTMDGAFQIETNGNASFENHEGHNRSDVAIIFTERGAKNEGDQGSAQAPQFQII